MPSNLYFKKVLSKFISAVSLLIFTVSFSTIGQSQTSFNPCLSWVPSMGCGWRLHSWCFHLLSPGSEVFGLTGGSLNQGTFEPHWDCSGCIHWLPIYFSSESHWMCGLQVTWCHSPHPPPNSLSKTLLLIFGLCTCLITPKILCPPGFVPHFFLLIPHHEIPSNSWLQWP